MIKRHQQYPTPSKGTWQFDVYEKIFHEPYDKNISSVDNVEKINKFNYHLFLHPSVIAKFDTNSEDFDMYLRKLNINSPTPNEIRNKTREYFCKKILPVLNLTDDANVGTDFANFVVNKNKNNTYGDYLYENYSNQTEEELFRIAEENKFISKNDPFVQRVSYSNIKKERIGIRANELTELLNNPTKFKKMRRALEHKYPYYEPVKQIDQLKYYANQINFYNTIIDREVDTTSADFKMEDLYALQHDRGEGADNTEEEAIGAWHLNKPGEIPGVNHNTYPYGQTGMNLLYYNPNLDYNDYANSENDFPINVVSPKKQRYQMFANLGRQMLHHLYYRDFNSWEFADKRGYVVPPIDYKNEELKSRVLFRSNYHRFVDNIEVRDSDKEKLEFLEDKTMDDSYAVSDDITEEQLDQALFEASYNKPYYESDEFRSKFIFEIFLKIF
jgi:hypothetical protein